VPARGLGPGVDAVRLATRESVDLVLQDRKKFSGLSVRSWATESDDWGALVEAENALRSGQPLRIGPVRYEDFSAASAFVCTFAFQSSAGLQLDTYCVEVSGTISADLVC